MVAPTVNRQNTFQTQDDEGNDQAGAPGGGGAPKK